MIAVSFIFKPFREDGDFETLNETVDLIAKDTAGYLGRKKWSDEHGCVSVVYYWDSMESLRVFERDPTHKLAKSRYEEWYEGYRVEVAEVLKVYGDGYFDDQYPSE